MKILAFLLVTASLPQLAHASAQCSLLLAQAHEQSALLRAPSAIAALGDSSVSEQNAVAGVQISLADRRRAAIIDDAATVQCFRDVALNNLNAYLKYAPIDLQQTQARAENEALAGRWSDVDRFRGEVKNLIAAHQATIGDFISLEELIDNLLNQRYQNETILGQNNQFDTKIKISQELAFYQSYTQRLEHLNALNNRATGWDVTAASGGRQPIYDNVGRDSFSPFVALTFRYSFGMQASRRAGDQAESLAAEALSESATDPVSTLNDLRLSLLAQLKTAEEQRAHLTEQIDQYAAILSSVETIGVSQARVTASVTLLHKLQIEVNRSGLDARINWIKRQIVNIDSDVASTG